MVSPQSRSSSDPCRRLCQRLRAVAPDPNARLVDPGFPREPGVIGAANRAAGAREKYRAARKAFSISLDAGGNRVSGLRTLDHDHAHYALLENNWAEKHRPVGVRLLSVRRTWGASRTLSDRASGSGAMLVTGLIPTGRIPLKRTLDVERSFPGRRGEEPW